MILPETDENGAMISAEKLRQSIERYDFDISDGKVIRVTASFGVSSLQMVKDIVGDKEEQMIRLADDALYSAKEGGRNRIILSNI